MNYYAHHIGDYAAATSHLSWDEDLAYTRLLRAYYQTERPLPVEVRDVCRLIRAQGAAQKKAVEAVLLEFFKKEQDGWHQKRCDEEITRFHDKRSKAERSANARWHSMRSDSDGSANASGSGNANALRTQSEGNAPNPNPNPNPNIQSQERARASRLPTDWVLTPERRAIAEGEKLDPDRTFAKFTDYWRSANGANARKLDWDATWRNWCRTEADRKPANGNGLHLTKFDRMQAASSARKNADGDYIDEAGNVIPF